MNEKKYRKFYVIILKLLNNLIRCEIVVTLGCVGLIAASFLINHVCPRAEGNDVVSSCVHRNIYFCMNIRVF